MAEHAPDLARKFDRAGLSVGAGDGDRHIRERRKETRGKLREKLARIDGGDVDRSIHLGFRTGNDSNGTSPHRFGNIVFAVDTQTLKGAENGARRDLAIVDGKTRDGRVEAASGAYRFGDLGIQLLD